MEVQLGFFGAYVYLLELKPIFLLGFVLVGLVLLLIFRRNRGLPKIKITVYVVLMYYYACMLFGNIVGIPTLREFSRLSQLGESLFHPNINLVPFSDGLSLSFILNIFLFIPAGFFCPMISKTYEHVKNTILFGLGLSLIVEISQLFTLFRATDINDLLTNVLGTLIGYLCFRLVVKLKLAKSYSEHGDSLEKDVLKYLPIIIVALAFIIIFTAS